MMTASSPATIQLSSDHESLLNSLTTKTGRSRDSLIQQALTEGLEDLSDALIAEEGWSEHLASGEPATPYDAVRRELGLPRP